MATLSGRVALVTGGAEGLGRAIAARLKSDGATVFISDINGKAGEAAVAAGFQFVAQDVCDEHRWAEVIGHVEADGGRLDILVNNAGIIGDLEKFSPRDTTLDNWRRVFSVNVESVLLGCQAAIPAMERTGGGAIVNISSVAGLLATPYNTAYGASKAAVRQLTKSVAQYCAEAGLNIRCNSVHPGDVWTPMWEEVARAKAGKAGIPVEQIIAEGEMISPLGGFTKPEDVAAAVAFLVSDDAQRVTGMKMIVDGGLINCDTYHLWQHLGSRRALSNTPPSNRS
jgi:NAD(P)-dependent dehydrogenase (short-subunit alcohol dehydrogenase family)